MRLEASGLTPTTEITTSKRSEFLPHSPFLPLFITLWWRSRSRPPVATSSLSVLLRISWSTSPFREEERDFKSPSLSIGGKNGMCEGTFNSTSVQRRQKNSTVWRIREGMLPATTARRPSAQQGIWEHKTTTTTSPLLLGRGGGGRGRHRPFSRLCYLSRRQFRNSGAVPQNRLCEIGLNPESEMSMLGSLDAQI